MNAIQIGNRVEDYLDIRRSARFERLQIDDAVNDAIDKIIVAIIAEGFQKQQPLSDRLFTLQKTQTAAPTTDIALYPADYKAETSMYATIAGVRKYCRPTNQNKKGPLEEDTFRRPKDTKPYYEQVTTGFKILHGSGTVSSVELNYIKTPVTFTIGKDTQLISPATNLVNASVYIATEPTLYTGTNLNIGDQFTAIGTTPITTGQVILASNTLTSDLPVTTHDEIAKMAAAILSGSTQDYTKSQFANEEAAQS